VTKKQRYYIGEKMVLPLNGAGGTGYPHAKRKEK
jgi:hypothetical protein